MPGWRDRRWVIAAWVAVQLGLVGHGLLGGRWAWDMFAEPSVDRRTVAASARVAGGPWEPLAIDTLFRYRRGFTVRTVLDEAHALRPRGRRRERAAFAEWAVHELAPDAGYTEVELHLDVEGVARGRRSTVDLGTFPVSP